MKKVTTLLVRKIGHALHPADIVTDEYLGEVAQGRELHMKPWVPRNPRFHRTAMGYMHSVANSTDAFESLEKLMTWLKLEMGLYEIFVGHDGKDVYRLADSIDFGSMDEVHFRRFMRRAEFLINRDILPGWGVEDYVLLKKEAAQQSARYEGEQPDEPPPAPAAD